MSASAAAAAALPGGGGSPAGTPSPRPRSRCIAAESAATGAPSASASPPLSSAPPSSPPSSAGSPPSPAFAFPRPPRPLCLGFPFAFCRPSSEVAPGISGTTGTGAGCGSLRISFSIAFTFAACAAWAFSASAITVSRASTFDIRYRVDASPIALREPTQSICVTPACSNFATSASIALFVAVHARMRAPLGTRDRHAAVMKCDLPVPGGPCTIAMAPSSFSSAVRCPGFSRFSCAFAESSAFASGTQGDGASLVPLVVSACASEGSSFLMLVSAYTRASAVIADASSTHFTFSGGSRLGGFTCPWRSASTSRAIAR